MKTNKFYKMRNEESLNCLGELISYINSFQNTKELTMVEIGSYIGESTTLFAKHFEQVISIDPFINDYDETDDACSHADFEDVYIKFLSNIDKFRNIMHIRHPSKITIKWLSTPVDFVYIDGNHLYEFVKEDIINYLPLIKQNGFIGGHDYTRWHTDVIKAVDETISVPDKVFCDGSWIKQIK